MNDEAVRDLARRAGIAVEWNDYAGRPQVVAPDVLRRILDALGLPSATRGDLLASRRAARPAIQPRDTAAAGHCDRRAANAARRRGERARAGTADT